MNNKEIQKKETSIDITTVYIGAKIQSLREERNISQTDFGKLIGLSRASIVNLEAGRQASPMRTILEMCVAFNVTVDKILPTNEWYLKNRHKKARKIITIEIYED